MHSTSGDRIYLDNAATSWPKPEAVYVAVDSYLRDVGAPASRGAYREAVEVNRAVETVRRELAKFIGAEAPERIAFAFNGTDALNMAIHGILAEGDHVVTTVVEHNSVLRPLRFLEDARGITVTRVSCGQDGVVSPDDIKAALRPNTKLVAISHVSNVTGAIQPIREIGKLTREGDVLLLADAAQSVGHVPLSVADMHIDLLASSGHKGLLGPLGSGFLYVRTGIEDRISSFRQGGTGTQSDEDQQPESMPHKFESGNLNVPGILGMGEGLRHIVMSGWDDIVAQERDLVCDLIAGFGEIDGVTVCGPPRAEQRSSVVSVTVEGYDPQEVAALLDTTTAIQVRSGLHCAPLMHHTLGTTKKGGTVRFSVGPFNTPQDITAAVQALSSIAAASVS